MNEEQFWTVLRQITTGWTWTIFGMVRRFVAATMTTPHEICPVCAVANHVLGDRRYYLEGVTAAKKIGLDVPFAKRVIRAADNARHRDPEVQRIRKKLEEVLGL